MPPKNSSEDFTVLYTLQAPGPELYLPPNVVTESTEGDIEGK